jgi:peptidylprolyl isomerase
VRVAPYRFVVVLALLVAVSGCRLKEEAPPPESSGAAAAPPGLPAPPDVAAPPADALKTASGLASKIVRVGLGDVKPTLRSTVVVHYTGWTTDGKMFDSSVVRGEPITSPLLRSDGRPQFIDGWMEALQLMRAGEKRRVWIPADLAYGKIPDPPGRPNPKGMLVFDMELLQIR